MKWINFFTISKIPFYIYKLNKSDSIIYINKKEKHTSIIIAHGILYLLKIFTNQEILTLGILSKENIVHSSIDQQNCYYKLIAIEDSILISFQYLNLVSNHNSNIHVLMNIFVTYQNTLHKYEMMNHILIHKYTKQRVVQLILFLFKEFGLKKENHIVLPFRVSQKTISIITGSNRCTINKIMHKLHTIKAISYSHKKYICLIDPYKLIEQENEYNNNLIIKNK